MTEEQTLDPDDWDEIRQAFHAATDLCLEHMQGVRERPVWRPTPEAIKQQLHEALPRQGAPIRELLAFFQQTMLPYSAGNTHPRFWGWVNGSGTVAGVMGEMLAAFMNCNAGGRNHIAAFVERQVIDWCKEIFDFPASSSGILTSGTSMGMVIALAVARNAKSSVDVRKFGVAAAPRRPIGYTSVEAHGCIAKSFELLGLGNQSLRTVAVDGAGRMKVDHLSKIIAADRTAGLAPAVVIATAGTVNTGAIDDLEQIAQLCRSEGLWLHVDGAFGGLAIVTPEFRPQLAAIAGADSVAFDFHKWLHVPYDAGCVLIKNEPAHRSAFSLHQDYLVGNGQGLAGGEPWYCDYGPELSRGFRALKVWFTLKAYGMDRLGELIARNCRQAQQLAMLIAAHTELELLAKVSLNIVCFRYAPSHLPAATFDSLNARIVTELQVRGIAAPSTTRIGGKMAIRVSITNHRTMPEDLEVLVAEVLKLGKALGE